VEATCSPEGGFSRTLDTSLPVPTCRRLLRRNISQRALTCCLVICRGGELTKRRLLKDIRRRQNISPRAPTCRLVIRRSDGPPKERPHTDIRWRRNTPPRAPTCRLVIRRGDVLPKRRLSYRNQVEAKYLAASADLSLGHLSRQHAHQKETSQGY